LIHSEKAKTGRKRRICSRPNARVLFANRNKKQGVERRQNLERLWGRRKRQNHETELRKKKKETESAIS